MFPKVPNRMQVLLAALVATVLLGVLRATALLRESLAAPQPKPGRDQEKPADVAASVFATAAANLLAKVATATSHGLLAIKWVLAGDEAGLPLVACLSLVAVNTELLVSVTSLDKPGNLQRLPHRFSVHQQLGEHEFGFLLHGLECHSWVRPGSAYLSVQHGALEGAPLGGNSSRHCDLGQLNILWNWSNRVGSHGGLRNQEHTSGHHTGVSRVPGWGSSRIKRRS